MVSRTTVFLLPLFWAGSVWTSSATAETIAAQIIQKSNDRLYFSVGTESFVYRNCTFTIMCDKDTVYSGCIEQSSLGVSFSYPAAQFADTASLRECKIQIEAAEPDSLGDINIGLSGITPELWSLIVTDSSVAGHDSDSSTQAGAGPDSQIRFHEYPDYIDLGFKMQLGELDGFVSFTRQCSDGSVGIIRNSPAPFIVAMIPNLSKEKNRGGHLTTSLYYRFNDQNLSPVFAGDEVTPAYGFCAGSQQSRRPFPYSASTGQRLLSEQQRRITRVRLWVMDKSLEKLGWFFADVLARDRVEVELADEPGEADLFLVCLRYDSQNQSLCLEKVMEFLKISPARYSFQNELLDSVETYLRTAAESEETEQRATALRAAEQVLIYDLAAMPLFRPHLFFYASHSLTGYRFDNNGRFTVKKLAKLRLPPSDARCGL